MKKPMRRSDRAVPDKDARALLQNGEYGILSTVSSDGQPYGVPINYCFINNEIQFHCAPEGHKLENIKKNNKVSFCVVGRTEVLPEKFSARYESVIAFGRTVELTGEEKRRALIHLLEKYCMEFFDAGLKYMDGTIDKTRVYKILIESISGKSRK